MENKPDAKEQEHQESLKKSDVKKKTKHQEFMEEHERIMQKLNENIKRYAQGGEVQHFDEGGTPDASAQDDDEDSRTAAQPQPGQPPVNININAGQPQNGQPPQVQAQPQQAPKPAPSAMAPLQQPQDGVFDAPDNLKAAIAAPSPMQALVATHDQAVQEGNAPVAQHTEDFKNDLINGHIQPKTYRDLFAKNADGTDKGTLSKVGTLFGLLVGGAGAGLTHTENPILQMMDKEIDRDLTAQQHSKDNALNFWKVNQSDLATKGQSAVAIRELSKNQMRLSTFDELAKTTQNMPPGPKKTAALQTLGAVYAKIGDAIANSNSIAAGANALYGTSAIGGGAAGANNGAVNYQKLNDLDRRAKMGDPTVNATDVQRATDEAAHLEPIRSFRNNFNNAFKELDGMAVGGKLSPNKRDSLVSTLASDFSKATGYGAEEAKKKIDSLIPKATDWSASTKEEKLRNVNNYFDTLESGQPTLKRMNLLNQYEAPTRKKGNDSGMVSVVSPDGKVGSIPKANLQKAMDAGYKRK